jgi:glutamate decarboxylase
MTNLTRTADYLSDSLEQLGFVIMSQKNGQGLPLVAFRFKDGEKHYDEFALAHQLRGRSWVVPAYTMAPHTEDLKMLRVVVREDFSKSRCDQLLCDIKLCKSPVSISHHPFTLPQHHNPRCLWKEFANESTIIGMEVLDEMDKDQIKKNQTYIKAHVSHSGKSTHNHPHYKKEKHSLQGKTGKTHAIC